MAPHTSPEKTSFEHRLLRVCVPLDCALSGIFVLLVLALVPVLSVSSLPPNAARAVELILVVSATALAAMGLFTAWAIVSAMRRGQVEFPRVRLPLPEAVQLFKRR